MEIEQLATSAINQVISKTDYIIPYINSGDKAPSWDGYFELYSDKSKNKRFYFGKALIQVKGRSCKSFSLKEFKYSININDLRNYQIEGGTLYFVVQINKNGESKIFYNALLPFELNNILKDASGKKKSVSVKMYEFPTNKNEVTNIVFNFVRDKENQSIIKNGNNIEIKELIQQFGKEKIKYSFSYTGLGYDRDKPYEYLFTHDVYLYAQHTELNIKIPVNHMWRAELCQSTIYGEVMVDNKVYYTSYNIIHRVDTDEIHIGKSIRLKLGNGTIPKLEYNLKGSLNERIIAEKMMLNLYAVKKLYINGYCFEINIDEKRYDIRFIESHLTYITELKEILDKLGVVDDLDCSIISQKDEEYIRMLIAVFKHSKLIEFKEEIQPMATVPIGNLTILLTFKHDKNGKYIIKNHTDCDLDVYGEMANGSRFKTSRYTILKKSDFMNISNLKENEIVDELMTINNPGHLSRTNYTLLEMIKAYDKIKKPSLIYEAIRLAEWLNEKEKSSISIINCCQCYYRIRELRSEEKNLILNIINNSDDIQIKLAGNILLQNESVVQNLFCNMNERDKKIFEEYPLYNLMTYRN